VLIVLWYILQTMCKNKIEIPCSAVVLPTIMLALTFEAESQIYLPLCYAPFCSLILLGSFLGS
jgi:hypothetical protein